MKRLLATLIAASVSLEIDIEHTLESCLAKLETADEIEGRGAGAILGSRPLNDPATNPSFPPRPVRLHLGRSVTPGPFRDVLIEIVRGAKRA